MRKSGKKRKRWQPWSRLVGVDWRKTKRRLCHGCCEWDELLVVGTNIGVRRRHKADRRIRPKNVHWRRFSFRHRTNESFLKFFRVESSRVESANQTEGLILHRRNHSCKSTRNSSFHRFSMRVFRLSQSDEWRVECRHCAAVPLIDVLLVVGNANPENRFNSFEFRSTVRRWVASLTSLFHGKKFFFYLFLHSDTSDLYESNDSIKSSSSSDDDRKSSIDLSHCRRTFSSLWDESRNFRIRPSNNASSRRQTVQRFVPFLLVGSALVTKDDEWSRVLIDWAPPKIESSRVPSAWAEILVKWFEKFWRNFSDRVDFDALTRRQKRSKTRSVQLSLILLASLRISEWGKETPISRVHSELKSIEEPRWSRLAVR